MDFRAFSEWFSPLSQADRIKGLTRIYSNLTVSTREFYRPNPVKENRRALEILQGINEIHHTISNQLVEYVTGGKFAYSVEGFSKMLEEIANRYHLQRFLETAVEHARTRTCP